MFYHHRNGISFSNNVNGGEMYHFRINLNPKAEESGWTGVGRHLDNNHTITPSSPRARNVGMLYCISKP